MLSTKHDKHLRFEITHVLHDGWQAAQAVTPIS
jgi:hypothetical protein